MNKSYFSVGAQLDDGPSCWYKHTEDLQYFLCAAIQGGLFEMKMYLHLFTTAGVCLTASVINFDLAEIFCWSSRVWSVPGSC